MKCYSETELLRLLDQGIPSRFAPALDRHLGNCHDCLAKLDRLTTDPSFVSQLKRLVTDTNSANVAPFSEASPETPDGTDHAEPEAAVPFAAWVESFKSELFDEASGGTLTDHRDPNALPLKTTEAGWPDIPELEIRRRIGQGGMGIVYEAFDAGLKRRVALKMLGEGRQSDEALHRLGTEAEAAARLNDAGIVQVYRFDSVDRRPYIVLEYIGGPTLAQRLAGRPQPPREAAALLLKLARSLHYAHQRQVIHRDLKPSNILFEEDDNSRDEFPLSRSRPKITDFGLAKFLDADTELTRDGQMIGTPTYSAPEQLGRRGDKVGPSADVYSLGAILYTMLTGRPPLQGEDLLRTVQMVQETEPVSPRHLQPEVPIDLNTIALRCLMKDPRQRYVDAGELAEDLERFLSNEPIRARPIGRAARVWRWARRNPAVATSTTLLGTMIVVAASVSVLAAIHFQGLVKQLEQQRIAAERSLRDSRLALADSLRTIGMNFQREHRQHLAALCYAEAACQLNPSEDLRQAYEIRVATALQETPRPLVMLDAPSAVPSSDVFFHPSGRWLIAQPQDPSAAPTLWDIDAATTRKFPSDFGAISALAWGDEGQRLLIGTEDGRVLITSFPRLELIREVRGGKGITRLATSKDGSRIAFASDHMGWWCEVDQPSSDAAATLRSTDVFATVLTPPAGLRPDGESSPIVDLSFGPDGRFLAVASADGRLSVLKLGAPWTPPVLETMFGVGTAGSERTLPQFDPFGNLVVWSDGKLTWYDLVQGRTLRAETTPPAIFCEVSATTGEVVVGAENHMIHFDAKGRNDFGVDTRISACWLTDGGLLTGPARNDNLIRWRSGIRDGQGWPLFQPEGTARLRQSPDGARLATINGHGRVQIWKLPSSPFQPIRIDVSDQLEYGTFHPDGTRILIRSDRFGARIHQTADGRPCGPMLRPDGELITAEWLGDRDDVITIAHSDRGSAIDVWDGIHGTRRHATILGPSAPRSPGDPDARFAISPGADRLACIAASPRDLQVVSLDEPASAPVSLGLVPQALINVPHASRLMVVNDGTKGQSTEIVILDWASLSVIARHLIDIDSRFLADPSGRLVAIAGQTTGLRFIDPSSGRFVESKLADPKQTIPIAFAAAGQRLLTREQDRCYRLWDLASGELSMPPKLFARDASAMLVADGRTIFTAWDDLSFHLLSTSDGQPVCPEIRVDLGTTTYPTDRFSLSGSSNGRWVAVGGLPSLLIFDLDSILAKLPIPPQELRTQCQLTSGHTLEQGQPIPIDAEAWERMWPRSPKPAASGKSADAWE